MPQIAYLFRSLFDEGTPAIEMVKRGRSNFWLGIGASKSSSASFRSRPMVRRRTWDFATSGSGLKSSPGAVSWMKKSLGMTPLRRVLFGVFCERILFGGVPEVGGGAAMAVLCSSVGTRSNERHLADSCIV